MTERENSTRATLLEPMFEEIPAPEHPSAQRLHALWENLRQGDDLPARDDFSFERLAGIGVLGNAFVIEPVDGGLDWRYRLMGSNITWLFGRDVTNLLFSVHFVPKEAEQCIAFSNRVAASRKPIFLKASFVSGGHSGELETMSLPIRSRDGRETWLIGASFPSTSPDE